MEQQTVVKLRNRINATFANKVTERQREVLNLQEPTLLLARNTILGDAQPPKAFLVHIPTAFLNPSEFRTQETEPLL